ncbi:Ig-like domain-containing protein [Acinetobacter gerneri]|uniref:BapA/Bap/LapF family prefix-like domain-containing protein n=1 Tax=Acinetobacter gerneri TaxID=202952 RepID=UPI003AF6E2E5
MKRVDIISKGTHKILESREDSNFVLSENSVVIINTPIKAIKKIERIGNDLVIHFSKTDEPLIIKNYYNDNNNADNSLVLKTEDGRLLWIQDLENAGVIDKAINYQVIDDVELLLYQEDSPYMAALPWLTGGILIAALAYGNREKNGAPKEDKPIFKDPVAINAYEDNVGSKTGTFGILKPTDDTTPGFVIGTLEDDRTPVLYVDGKEVASVYDRENGILTPVEPLSEGSHLIAYKEVDGKGNEGDLGEAAEIIIDTTAPNQPDTPTEYIDDAGEKTGHFDFTVSTDDTTPTIVIGDIPADETPTLYVDGRPVESIYDAENGTLTPKTPLSEGTHEISYTLTDEAGNESFQSETLIKTPKQMTLRLC